MTSMINTNAFFDFTDFARRTIWTMPTHRKTNPNHSIQTTPKHRTRLAWTTDGVPTPPPTVVTPRVMFVWDHDQRVGGRFWKAISFSHQHIFVWIFFCLDLFFVWIFWPPLALVLALVTELRLNCYWITTELRINYDWITNKLRLNYDWITKWPRLIDDATTTAHPSPGQQPNVPMSPFKGTTPSACDVPSIMAPPPWTLIPTGPGLLAMPGTALPLTYFDNGKRGRMPPSALVHL